MSDYERIARVIRFLDEQHTAHPSLEELAGVVGLSDSQFHRLFTGWAGVTPKAFLKCLTLEHARALTDDGASLFDAALGVGLSGPSRLHDLCVTLEAASPGDIKSGGAGMRIGFGFGESTFGDCLVGWSERGLCHLAFVEAGRRSEAGDVLVEAWPRAELIRDDGEAVSILNRVFASGDDVGERSRLRAYVKGTAFQVRVWRSLLEVKPGTLTTYKRLAESIGLPNASRAVGTAVGANPLAYLIPCHRVIQGTGAIGGYRWGPERKRAMIAWESAREE
ncbi:MAG: methylated-DNA--[protein]-cysteine S-methyltransferase [Planctomycetota bacterium]|jgi:AraC family transcriptional regulator of adaptative response/methylated-DNA-[protein]-cysteine methyltransferase